MKLVAIDLDGTLLSSECTISDFNKKAIRDVQEQGNTIVISSGRSLHDTKKILKLADIDCPIISGNGAITCYSDKIIQQQTISEAILSELIKLIEKMDVYYEVYTNEGIFIKGDRKDILNDEIQNIQGDSAWAKDLVEIQYSQHNIHFVQNDLELTTSKMEPYKVFVFSFDMMKLDTLKRILSDRDDISITTSGAQKLELGNNKASKGNALLFLADYLGVSLKDTVAIGDNLNDVSMFEVAGISIAMENGEAAAKEKAHYITKHCNNDGVGYALGKYVLEKSFSSN
ncbi:Cof-type HAD-IIB family hydrolase [Virgibacillus halodenitrificans]|uniref:Cof-type HAD-IIB family hydrolase n=1 Tax=Virgibacillus halodenitrificans TaxID=1482 RepID=UPI00136890BF|nr:Cof-type HAD-IIB family hydrolase [Virgibacillus halodenitrificans]